MGSKQEKRTRNVAKDLMQEVVDNHLNPRLDSIEKFCQDSLNAQNERAKAVQGFVVREVQFKIANQLHNMQITMDAFVEVMAESGLTIADLASKIDSKKVEVAERMQKAAEEEMKSRLEGEATSAAEPVAKEAAPTEASAETPAE